MQKTDSMIEYWHFSGLGFCTPYRISNYLLINDIFPQFQIDTLYDKWIDNPITFAAFKIQEDNYIGYAISHTNARQTIKKILDIGSDIVFSCLNCPKKADIMHSTGLKYSISFDKNMYKAIMGRFQGKYDISWRKQNLGGGRIGIEEKGMLFCWLTVYAKGFSNNFEEKVLLDLQNELYNDVDWYEYTIPENKWKSEQLVYELVKQLYPNKSVFYQYRPDFLRFGNRQLSYDIYIPSEKIAFEYQGRQHFEPVDFFGGEEHYKKQVERDELKRKSSKEAGILLVYINYWDDLNIELLKKRIMEAHQKI